MSRLNRGHRPLTEMGTVISGRQVVIAPLTMNVGPTRQPVPLSLIYNLISSGKLHARLDKEPGL